MAITPRRLTDDELLATNLRVSEPESLPNLSGDTPDPNANPQIIGWYDETPIGGRKARPRKPFVRCCHCSKRRHWKGRIVRDDTGKTYIIGASKCGRDHYGVRYQNAESAFKSEQQRQRTLGRWRAALPLVQAYENEVSALLASEALKMLELKRSELQRSSPTGFAKLAKFAETQEEMSEIREERDFRAEQLNLERYQIALSVFNRLPKEERRRRRDEGLEPQHDDNQVWRRVVDPIGHLTGGGFLIDRGDVRSPTIRLRTTLSEARGIQDSHTDGVPTSELNRLLRQLTELPKIISEAMIYVGFSTLFFEEENLDRIVRWSRGEHRFSYNRDHLSLVVRDTSRGVSHIAPMSEIIFPDCPAINGARFLNDDFEKLMA